MRKMMTVFSIFFFTQLLYCCTMHQPFSGEPLICFRKKCRAKKIIAKRISKSRSSIKKSKFHVNGKYVPGPGKAVSTMLLTDTLYIQSTIPVSSIPSESLDTITIIVQFDFDRYHLTSEDEVKLSEVKQYIYTLDYLFIYIHGHTDNAGEESYNMQLSEKRAALVKEYLVAEGFSSDKLKTIGHGSHFPLTSNATEAGRKMNRRVEFKIVSKI
jgi:outer membrane protein OmpA-like peptidoglycan-associated protein